MSQTGKTLTNKGISRPRPDQTIVKRKAVTGTAFSRQLGRFNQEAELNEQNGSGTAERNATQPKTPNLKTRPSTQSIKKKTSPQVVLERTSITPQSTSKCTKSIKVNKEARESLDKTGSRSVAKKPTLPKQPPLNKSNRVLDTYHNVTVASPPPKRKLESKAPVSESTGKKLADKSLHKQTSSSLIQEKVVVFKNRPNRTQDTKEVLKGEIGDEYIKASTLTIKEPVSFEINLEPKGNLSKKAESHNSRPTTQTCQPKCSESESECNYSDDFESYESDFEAASSSSSNASEKDNLDNEKAQLEKTIGNSNDNSTGGEDEELKTTQNPKSEIQSDKEHKLDSGNYEINTTAQQGPVFNRNKSSQNPKQSNRYICDSLEGCSQGEDLDSGISGFDNFSRHLNTQRFSRLDFNVEVHYGGYTEFNAKPFTSERGADLLAKIQFDAMSYTLLDMKPISYEMFMQAYGDIYSRQASIQTEECCRESEMQTEDVPHSIKWTQQSPLHGARIYESFISPLTCAEVTDGSDCQLIVNCEIDASFKALRNLTNRKKDDRLQQNAFLKMDNLYSFLLRASLTILQVLTFNQREDDSLIKPKDANFSVFSESYYCLKSNFLNALKVMKIFSNPRFNLLITVHETLQGAEFHAIEFTNILMVWSINNSEKPIRILSTWSEVTRAEISNVSPHIVVSALHDGSIAMWDLNETLSYCSKLDDNLQPFAATQTIMPLSDKTGEEHAQSLILGPCIDIKSFLKSKQVISCHEEESLFETSQFISLHDSGALTVWTLVQTTNADTNELFVKKNRPKQNAQNSQLFENVSPWARVKLIQSAIINLRQYLEVDTFSERTHFAKTKEFFHKNIYSDEALRELQKPTVRSKPKVIRFNCLDAGCDNIYVCTNHSFILICTKTLKPERFRIIPIHQSPFLFPTSVKILSNEHFLAVGFSNGAVSILNCEPFNKINNLQGTTNTQLLSRKRSNTPPREDDTDMGKSCAIQNIILKEKKPLDASYSEVEVEETRRDKAASVTASTTKQKSYEVTATSEQTILSGLISRNSLVQALDVSCDGWRLFALTNGTLRIYDFYLEEELKVEVGNESSTTDGVLHMAVAKATSEGQHLIILRNHDVEIHKLKKTQA